MSAVAYVLSGICKDIMLVTLGAVVWNEVVTRQQVPQCNIEHVAHVALLYYMCLCTQTLCYHF